MKYPNYETDNILGLQIQTLLREASVESPISLATSLFENDEAKEKEIAHLVREIMKVVGLDTVDISLRKTPYNVAERFLKELFWGMDYDKFPKMYLFKNKAEIEEMVYHKVVFETIDERNLLPNQGIITFGYIPDKLLINPDELCNIVAFFSSRTQNSARLCAQLLFTLKYILSCDDVAVRVNLDCIVTKYKGKFALPYKYVYRNEFNQICQK